MTRSNSTENFTVEFAVNEEGGAAKVAVNFSGQSWNRTLTFGEQEAATFLREMFQAYRAAWEINERKRQANPGIFIPTMRVPKDFGN